MSCSEYNNAEFKKQAEYAWKVGPRPPTQEQTSPIDVPVPNAAVGETSAKREPVEGFLYSLLW